MTESMITKKLCIIGDGATGKTCILFRFLKNKFDDSEEYNPTIFENEIKICDYHGQKVKLSLWDTAGQEGFENIRILAYENTHILLVTFNVTERGSFENVRTEWLEEIKKNKKKFGDPKIILVGTKADLRNETGVQDQEISKAEAKALAKEINAVCYIETSSKTGDGISELLDESIKAVMSTKDGNKKFCFFL